MDPLTLIIVGLVVLYALGKGSATSPTAAGNSSSVASTNALGSALQTAIKGLTSASSGSGSKGGGGSSGGGSGGGSSFGGGGRSITGAGSSSTSGYNSAVDAFNANDQSMYEGNDKFTIPDNPGTTDVLTPDDSYTPIDPSDPNLYMSTDQIEQGIADAGWGGGGGGGSDWGYDNAPLSDDGEWED